MRPYVPSDSVRDKSSELPHYYCNLHNPDPDTYPAEPGKSVTIVEVPPVLPPEDENPEGENPGGENGEQGGDSDTPTDPNNPGQPTTPEDPSTPAGGNPAGSGSAGSGSTT